MKSKLLKVAMIVLLIAGLLVLFYPALNNIIFVHKQNQVINQYNEQIVNLNEQVVDEMREEAQQYNELLSGTVTNDKVDGDSQESVSGNLSYSQLLNVQNELMGYIVIPEISLNQPIYHSTDDEVLERGIGHMENTSLPIGGENTHSVLTGHSGVPGMMLFTDLEKMEVGDKFYLRVLDEVLAYEVDQIKVILPNVTDDFKIVEGRDLVTLVTCTPYGVNTHRLLVRGTRVPYNGEIDDPDVTQATNGPDSLDTASKDEKVVSTKQSKYSPEFILYYILIPSVISVVIIFLIVFFTKRKKKQKSNE